MRLRQLAAAILIGALIGGGIVTAYTGQQLEELYTREQAFLYQLNSYRHRLEQVNDRLQTQRSSVIDKVDVRFANIDDQTIRLALQEQLAPFLEPLIGQPVDSVDPFLILGLFEDRSFTYREKVYIMHPKILVLRSNTELVLEVEISEARMED